MTTNDDNFGWEWPTDDTPVQGGPDPTDFTRTVDAWRQEPVPESWASSMPTTRIDTSWQQQGDWAAQTQDGQEPAERSSWISEDSWKEPELFKPEEKLEPIDWDAMRRTRRDRQVHSADEAETHERPERYVARESRAADTRREASAERRSQSEHQRQRAQQPQSEHPRHQRTQQSQNEHQRQRTQQSRRQSEQPQQVIAPLPTSKWDSRDTRQRRAQARGLEVGSAWDANGGRGGRGSHGAHGGSGYGQERPIGRRAFIAVGALAAVAAVGFAGSRIYLHMSPIPAVIGGAEAELEPGTTYDDLVSSGRLPIKRGDLVAVDESTVLQAGGGEDYIVYANGSKVDNTGSTVKRKAEVTGESGKNIIEESTAVETVVPYTVEMQGVGAISSVTRQGVDGLTIERTGSISGMVAESSESIPMQTCLIESYNINPEEKLVALTFDDGPSQYTPQYLDILSSHGAKATFFMLGENVESLPAYAKRVADEGHQVATHSMNHPNMFTLSDEEVRNQMVMSQDVIESATGVRPTVMRAPYGNWGLEQWEAVYDIITKQVIWNIDTEDWRRPGAAAIVSSITNNIRPGRVILMHDGGGERSQDVEALPQIIDQLHNAGYRFVTIDELDESGERVQGY